MVAFPATADETMAAFPATADEKKVAFPATADEKMVAFPKSARLLRRRDFLAVTDRRTPPAVKISGRMFLLLGRENGLGFNRLGVTVAKKTARRAVARNRIKRIVREFFRLNTPLWPGGFDLVFIAKAKSGAAEASRPDLWADLRRMGRKMETLSRPSAAPPSETPEEPLEEPVKNSPQNFAGRLAGGLALALIYMYRLFISPLLPPSCRFYPSCSRYAVEVYTSHGFWRASYLTARRLLKCHPFHPGGYDPAPPARTD